MAWECQGNLISFIWLNFEVLLPCCTGIHKGSITSAVLHRTKVAKKSHSRQAHRPSQDKRVNCSVYLGQTATLSLGGQQSLDVLDAQGGRCGYQFPGNGALILSIYVLSACTTISCERACIRNHFSGHQTVSCGASWSG